MLNYSGKHEFALANPYIATAFATMDASCGPSNALNQLSKHTQRDQSLQNEFLGRQNQPQHANFRRHGGIDANLNTDFSRFGQEGVAGFDQQFAAPLPQFQHAPARSGQAAQNQGWVQDFNGLSIKDRSQHHQAQQRGQPQAADWHQQFMRQQVQQNPQGIQQQQVRQQNMPMMSQGFRPATMGYADQQLNQSVQKQSHDETMSVLSSAEYMQTDFDEHFDRLEREMFAAEQAAAEEQTHDVEDELEKERFAEAARQVRKSMVSEKNLASEETSSKFHQSDFLRLMSLISERQVEISKEGDKLVEKDSGADIRTHLSDPLKHEKEAQADLQREGQPDYHQPLHLETFGASQQMHAEPVITRESENVRSHLPDPLAHIKDGSLPDNLTPLQAARIISGGQVMANDWTEDESWTAPTRRGIMPQEWQDVYDDYRNDDDFH